MPQGKKASTTLLPHSLTVATLTGVGHLKLERPCCNNSWERDKETLGLQPVPVTVGLQLGIGLGWKEVTWVWVYWVWVTGSG